MRVPVAVLVCLLAFLGPAVAEEKALTPEQAADAVRVAVKAEDGVALAALATKDAPDPWRVADELCRRGEHDAAEAFAKAAPRKDVERLPAYVASRRGKPDDIAARQALGEADAALQAGEIPRFVAALRSVKPDASTVVGVLLLRMRARALLRTGSLKESNGAVLSALKAVDALGWVSMSSRLYFNLGYAAYLQGETVIARTAYERSLALDEERGNRAAIAVTLHNLGNVYADQGDVAKAMSAYARSKAIKEALGDRRGLAASLIDMAAVHQRFGEHAKALRMYEEGLALAREFGEQGWVANAREGLGNVSASLGRSAKALREYAAALKIRRERGDRLAVSSALFNMGVLHRDLGQLELASRELEESLAIRQEVGYLPGVAEVLRAKGALILRQEDPTKAIELFEQALAAFERLGVRRQATATMGDLGDALLAAGRHEAGRRMLERAIRGARTLRSPGLLTRIQTRLARAHLDGGRPERALAVAQQALSQLESMLQGLDDEEGAGLRSAYADLFDVGVRAAALDDDVASLTVFLESGRAMALLQKRAGEQALAAAVVPQVLLDGEVSAKADLLRARAVHHQAVATGARKQMSRTRRDLETAIDAWFEASARIRREVKRQAALLYPRAASTQEIQASLKGDQALVAYALAGKQVLALVFRPEEVRTVLLGEAEDVIRAAERLAQPSVRQDADEPIALLSKRLIQPLGISSDVKTLVVSPAGPLWHIPWAALVQRPISLTPSATLHALLRETFVPPGKGVLAIGDPAYGMEGDAARMIYRSRPLASLPGTRAEAKRIGDVTLLGSEASESALAKTLATRPRWRAVHFGCHGIVDLERPMLSSLALSPEAENDGFLTALEVYRMRVPADLVTLAASDTARGRVYKGEGSLSLARAMLFAGAQRVIGMLWKPDDEATSALMVKFYELWNPRTGEGRLGVAEALRQAQAHVRAEPKWKHPYYWAGWVLLGLPD